MALKLTCPDQSTLVRLLLGELPDQDAAVLAEHLEECPACATAAQALKTKHSLESSADDEDFVTPPPPMPLETPAVRRLIDQVSSAVSLTSSQSATEARPASHAWSRLLRPPEGPGEIGRLGSYRVLRILGAGGMGVVFAAEDSQLKRPAALKVMLPALNANAEARQRFLREAQAAAAIKHDHIITIYQVGEDRGVPYLAMELLHGESLATRLTRERQLPWREIVRLGGQIAHALAAAHQVGLIHRDIKPANVWLEDRSQGAGITSHGSEVRREESALVRVKILDFGLARLTSGAGLLTQEGVVLGTPAYMAPEQADGTEVDARSDLFSLGCLLYHIATGQLPFAGKDMLSRMMALATTQPPAPRTLNPDIPTALSDLVMKLLAKNPDDRPATAFAVAKTLEKIAQSEDRSQVTGVRSQETEVMNPLPISVSSPLTPGPGRARLQRVLLAALGSLLLLAGVGALGQQIYLRITRDGKTQDIELKPGDKFEIVQKKPDKADPIVAADALPDKDKPFVILRQAGEKKEEFQHFHLALSELEKGDVIEVHGNGPFKVARVEREDLSLRAAPGYRPVFVPFRSAFASGEVWFSIKGLLRLEGCDFRCPHLFPSSEWGAFSGGPGIWEIKNCRLFCPGADAPLFRYTGSKLSVQDCLIATSRVFRVQEPVKELELVNNVFRSWAIGALYAAPEVIRLRNNTFASHYGFSESNPLKPKAPTIVDAVGNIFDLHSPTNGWLLDSPNPIKERIRWQGRHNLYVGATPFLVARPNHLAKDLAAWNGYWGSAEEGSKQVPAASYQHDSVWHLTPEKGLATLAALTDSWRKLNPSAPRHAGADLDLVGPGDAYVRALAAENRPCPKDRPAPDEKGWIVLIRDGKQVASFLSLQAAADAAVDGDVIETRIDGVLAPCTITAPVKGTKTLTLRAAPGYRTILAQPPSIDDPALRVQNNVTLTVENLHFRKVELRAEKGARLARVANCFFEKVDAMRPCIFGRLLVADGQRGEIVNCLAPEYVRLTLHDGDQPHLRNCVLAQVTSVGPEKGNGHLQFDRCFFWSPGLQLGPRANIDYHAFKGKITLSARDCWFEVGTQIPAQVFNPEEGRSLRKNAAWQGSRNIYRLGYREWIDSWILEDRLRQSDVESWRRYWNSPEEGSVVADPLDHDPLQWRLLPSSAGHKMAPRGKDVGADVDKVAHTAAPK